MIASSTATEARFTWKPRSLRDQMGTSTPSVDEISARPAAQKAVALKDRYAFKTEMDEEAKRAMFPGNYRAQAGA